MQRFLFLTSFFFFSSFISYSQTKDETIEYLRLLINQMDFNSYSYSTEGNTIKNFVVNWKKDIVIYKDYILIETYQYRKEYSFDQKNDINIVPIKNITSINIIKELDAKKPYLDINVKSDSYVYYINGTLIEKVLEYIDKDEIKMFQPWRGIGKLAFTGLDSEKYEKFIKAMNHLIKLNGGKILDDLF